MLSGLGEEALAALIRQCSWGNFRAGNLIIGQHDQSRDVLFLVSGLARVNVYSAAGKQVSFRDIRPGAVVGELSAIDARPRSADVEAIEDCVFFTMPGAVFRATIAAHPKFAEAVLLHLVTQVRRLTERVFEFSTLAVRSRVRAELLRLAEQQPDTGSGIVLLPAPKHADIAHRISTHREAVTRECSRLEDMGVIAREGRALRITDIEALRGLSADLEP
jgi:CRP-like cAMP-binding protein